MEASRPEVSVVVPSHERGTRLRWLLNALEEQTLPRSQWELVVVFDSTDDTEELVRTHALAPRYVRLTPGTGTASVQRNAGWRAAHAPLIAFTDDDCRPEPDWLERLLDAAHANPGAIVQGATRPDPFESDAMKWAPRARSIEENDPPGPHAQTCNILYPRALIESLGGFDERAVAGEDVDLSLRARSAGRSIVAAPEAVAYHAVESHTLPGIVRQNLKWRYLAYLVSRHPEFRRTMPLRLFWDEEHLWTATAMVGVLGAVRSSRRRGRSRQGRVTAIAEMPGQAVRQAAEVLGMAAGSVRHRTLVL
jgi:GT2 family glycosyltransferase